MSKDHSLVLRGELLLKGLSEGSPRPLLNFHVTLGPATRGAMKNAETISKTGALRTPAHHRRQTARTPPRPAYDGCGNTATWRRYFCASSLPAHAKASGGHDADAP